MDRSDSSEGSVLSGIRLVIIDKIVHEVDFVNICYYSPVLSRYMDPTLYIFDWSGTLSDDRRPVYVANMRVLSDYGKETMPYETWLTNSAMTPSDFFQSRGITAYSDVLFGQYKKHYDEINREGMVPAMYPESRDVLRQLHDTGHTVGIVSAHPEENLQEEIRMYGLAPYIDRVIGNVKEKVSHISTICKEYGMDPQSTVYIGDTVYDVRAAKEAGVRSAAITHGYHSAERLMKEQPDYLLHRLGDILELEKSKEGQPGPMIERSSRGSPER